MAMENFDKIENNSANNKYIFSELGQNVKIFDNVIFIKPENITIMDNSQIADFVYINGGIRTVIENNVHISAFSSVIGGGEFIMRSFSGLSAGCRIITGSDDFEGDFLTNPTVPEEFRNAKKGRVEIGRHTILGTNVIVLPNISIGEGVVVSAGAVVNKDLDDWSIYVGHTPKKVKSRDKYKVLGLELQYYRKYFANDMPERYLIRCKEIEKILAAQ